MRALLIDVVAQKIRVYEISANYKDIYAAIGNGCSCFTAPVRFENSDFLFVDDEALLHSDDPQGAFQMHGWRIPIVGNGLILGSNQDGETIDCITNPEDIIDQIIWYDAQEAKEYKEFAMKHMDCIM